MVVGDINYGVITGAIIGVTVAVIASKNNCKNSCFSSEYLVSFRDFQPTSGILLASPVMLVFLLKIF
ncbi:hypothetical protein A3Q29_14220 [Providencia stuartii]|uniref:Uncharacterized protein n=1 Tax=Providencia stuartii TaxID=588 RepID=A0A1S1HUB8_PROST|nr:hypothetical protein A3Q29_14220 [Providencia stuartii]